MHNIYPLRGDPLCPLGFHPQVRWPTRCKRCFRDYKEHGGKKRDEPSLRRDNSTASTPSLSLNLSDGSTKRSWVSSSNLAGENDKSGSSSDSEYSNPSSWISTPDLANLQDDMQAVPTVSIKLPKRKIKHIDTGQRTVSDSVSLMKERKSSIYDKNDTLATRVKKLQAIKESTYSDKSSRRIQIKEVKTISEEPNNHDVKRNVKSEDSPETSGSGSDHDDTVSNADTETTDTTLVGVDNELREQLESLRKELETTKSKCDRLEREKSDILLRRLAAMETTTSKTTATEVLKLQQKCNQLQQQLEDYIDDKRSLTLRVKEMEADLDLRPTAQEAQKVADELRSKLLAAETVCEELMDENEDMKKELRDMEEQIDEMQDNFREDQAVEYTSIKKELDQTTKNCRILSFKLRKAERKVEQLENEKAEIGKKLTEVSGAPGTLSHLDRIKQLEQDLKISNEVSLRLQKELEDSHKKLEESAKNTPIKKKAPLLGALGKSPSGDGQKVSRESLTRGGSQDDPAQLLRDLQDSLEREADLREQLKFAEEENNRLLRKKIPHKVLPPTTHWENKYTQTLFNCIFMSTQTDISLFEKSSNQFKSTQTDNFTGNSMSEKELDKPFESQSALKQLITSMQLRNLPMTQIRPTRWFSPMDTFVAVMGRKLSPTNQRLTPEPPENKDLSEDENLEEMKLQLELSEQEASVLRKKVEELEADNRRLKTKAKDLNEKLGTKVPVRKSLITSDKGNSIDNQKVKVLEDETNDLRKKLIEKERDCERLHAEIALNQKRSKGMQKVKSLDLDQQTLDLKRQLQVIEQEAAVLRSKVQNLESENDKLTAENKRLSLLRNSKAGKLSDKNLDKCIDQIAALEIDLADANKKIKQLESSGTIIGEFKGDFKKFSNRNPKKVSALTSRDQLKTMVSDLEKEISEILTYMKTSENEKIKLEEDLKKAKYSSELEKTLKDLSELKKKFEGTKKELDEEKTKSTKASQKSEELSLEMNKIRESLEKITSDKKKLKDQLEKLNKEQKKAIDEKTNLNDKLAKMKDQLGDLESKKDEVVLLNRKIESLKNALDDKELELKKLEKNAEEITRLNNENVSKDKKISDLEIRLTKFEDKYTACDKKLSEQSKDMERKIEQEKQKIKKLEEVQYKLEDEKKKLNYQIESLNTKIKGYENTIEQKDKLVKQLEESLAQEREMVSKTNLKIGELEGREISKLKDELSKKAVILSELESKLELANKSQKNLEDKLKKAELEKKNGTLEQEKKIKELHIDLQNEKKKVDVLKSNAEKEQKNRELELVTLKNKIKKLEIGTGGGIKRELELKQFQEAIEKLDNTISRERQKYDDLTAKYEILEEEHVVTKAKLVMEKETLENQFKNLKKEQDQLETELKTLRETYNVKQDAWIKEKLDIEQKLKDMSRVNYNGGDIDKQRLKALFEEKQSEVDQIKKEYDLIHNEMDYMRKENDELKRKLDDYEKVNKVQRNISADSSAMEHEIRHLRIKLNNAEKVKKGEVGECKMRYESQLSLVNQELQSLQNQVLRFKRERDNYKHMLETAQKTMSELKQSPKLHSNKGPKEKLHYDELEESKSKIATLEQQISCMEDELSESRLESSRLKTELISERSSWEVRLSELHSKVNELEEEKVLNSGRTKIMGLRTRMELAWQKEREEQQRLLQETATLARDLRQTLFEVERERDKERLEAKRKQDQFKKSVDEDQDETKRKITELQCDLLELRDAHAKLRTTNEKLRREKERFEKEREEFRLQKIGRRRTDNEDDRKIEKIVEQVDILKQLAPELFFSKDQEDPYTPTPPRRTKSKSRETSPAIGSRESSVNPEDKQQQIQKIMQRLVHTTEDLRKLQKYHEDEQERERLRRIGMRRATSTEAENVGSARYSRTVMRQQTAIDRQGSLHRKSLSLEHNIQADQKIWRNDNDDSMSSLQSLESDVDLKRGKRDSSLDSRLSGGSTQSDVGEKKKKKSLIGKLKNLTKSRSIDDQDPGTFSNSKTLSSKSNSRNNSNSDVNEEKGSKKDLKERLTGIFRRSGSSSRSNSVERKQETSSTQRPLVKNGSNGNINSGLS
ncbi:putative leucine-rich repeat-containing protein DDB_G0290503 isoform X2 [Dendroctonus ponderosae]|uniref:SOGA coiled-coil domain-containing protein n=1 Tax=Dendroctonus ponderosae TaxID=77166 RepID=A0AAR5NX95_DENPD|nr:putative leucine-rich repeat-containing protein DDB_G0290503 isoform X2 [Dendroctonus ponderosae]